MNIFPINNRVLIHKLSFIVFLILYSTFQINAQSYSIEVKIKGLKDTSIFLGHHFEDKKYVADTTYVDNNGKGIFTGDEKLDKGIYLIIMPNRTYFEIIMGEEQDFYIETDTINYIKNMKIKGSDENILFHDYQIFASEKGLKLKQLSDRKKVNKGNKDSVDIINLEMTEINKELKEYKLNISIEHPDYTLGKILKATVEVDIPDPPKDENGVILDSSFQYRYYKDNYFSNFDLSDESILRTPIYYGRINQFLKRMVYPHPDSLIVAADKLINKTRENEKVFRYTVQYIFNYYNTTKIMGLDEVFVHMAENYYLTGEATWADSSLLKKIEEKVIKLKPNLIGNKAPNLKLITHDNKWVTLHDIEAKFIILYFWDPDCGHCKKITPKIRDLQKELKNHDVKVLGVYTQVEQEKWLKYIKENDLNDFINAWDPYNSTKFRTLYDIYSTPVPFILNENKEIIAKRIDPETIKEILYKELGLELPKTENDEEGEKKKDTANEKKNDTVN
jgi:peroxiredoxin